MNESIMQTRLISPQKCIVTLQGAITEGFDFWNVSIPVASTLEIDMDRVTTINSVGLREFRSWVHSLRNSKIQLSRVPKVIIDQLNMVAGLVPPQTEVLSFYVPYFSEPLDEEKHFLFRRGSQFNVSPEGQVSFTYPDVRNSENSPMPLDVNPLRYFAFLERRSGMAA